jgi:peptidoglycan/LPS O-acetylase OafA/YrhL
MALFFAEGWLLSKLLPFHQRADKEELLSRRQAPLDGLRGILSLSVFFAHAASYYYFEQTKIWDFPPSNFYSQMAVFPVSMFFFITAYLFWSKLIQKPSFPVWRFWLGRFGRLEPVYIAVCSLVFLWVALLSGFHRQVSVRNLSIQILSFLTFWGPKDIDGITNWKLWLGASWSLRYEWLFYFSLPFLGWFAKRRRTTVLLVGIAFLLVPALARLESYRHLGGLTRLLESYAHFFAYTFSAGILIAILPKDRLSALARGVPATLLSLIAIGLTLFFVPASYGLLESLCLALPFACICMGNTWFGLLSSRSLRFLGRISYSFYLLHVLGLFFVLMIAQKRGILLGATPFSYWAIVAGSGMLTIFLCAFSYQFLEAPFLHMGRRQVQTRGVPYEHDASVRPLPLSQE